MVEDGLPLARRRVAIIATALGTLLSMMDSTIANVALPTIARDLGASSSSSIWIVNAYQLALIVFIVPLATLGDIVGYARVYRIGLIVFLVASVLCAFSHSLLALALARAVQGAGAAAMTSTIGSLNRLAYPRSMLGRSAGQGALVVAIGGAAGPVVAGTILSFAQWPMLFLINIPLGAIAVALAFRALPENTGSGHRFDWTSAVLSAVSFGALVGTISSFGHHEPPLLISAAVLGTIALFAVFIRRQFALPLPLFGVDLFAKPVFSLSIVSSVTSFMAQTIAYVALPFLFQNVLGVSAFATGMFMLPWLVAAGIMAPVAGRLSDRFEAGALGGIGMVILAFGLWMLAILPHHASTFDVLWRMAICGLGYGFFQSPNNRTILGSVDRSRNGAAQGILATARITGQALGAATVALVLGSATESQGGSAEAGPLAAALWVSVALAVVAAVASSFRKTRTAVTA